MSDNIRKAAGHLRAWPSAYRMGEHDTNVCIVAANGLDALEAKDQRIAELSRVLQMCGEAVNSVPADTFGLGTLTDAQGEEQVYPLRDELSQEIITVLASEDTRKEASSE